MHVEYWTAEVDRYLIGTYCVAHPSGVNSRVFNACGLLSRFPLSRFQCP